MDVDDAVGPARDEVGAEDLHVAGQHHERRPRASSSTACIARSCSGLRLRGDGQVRELHTEPLGDLGVVGMVADHHRHVDRQLTPTASERAGRRGSAPPSTPAPRRGGRRRRNAPRTACRSVRRRVGTRASISSRSRSQPSSRNSTRWKNTPSVRSVCCCGVDDVAAVAVDEVGGGRDDTGLVGARQQQDRGGRGRAVHPERSITRPATRCDAGRRHARERGRGLVEHARDRHGTPAVEVAQRGGGHDVGRLPHELGHLALAEPGAVVELGVRVPGAHEHHGDAGPPRLSRTAWVKLCTNALVAPYVALIGLGWYAASDDDVEDRTGAASFHRAERGVGEPQQRDDVELDLFDLSRHVELGEAAVRAEPCVVHEEVDRVIDVGEPRDDRRRHRRRSRGRQRARRPPRRSRR